MKRIKLKTALILLLIIILTCLFFAITYKTQKSGNTYIKSTDDIVENILSLSSYQATVEVTVTSNKTTNQYQLWQQYSKDSGWKQIVQEPRDLENITISYDGNTIKLENTSLGLNKLYENYEDYHYLNQNTLWLSSFISGYDGESKLKENDEEIILENNQLHNPYNVSQRLRISKKTKLPIAMEIQDNNQNTKIYINYKEIQLN